MTKNTYKLLMRLLNSKIFNKLLIKFTNSKFSKNLIGYYIKKFNINEKEINKDIREFKSLNDFFIRSIDENLRPIDKKDNILTSPSDGLLSHVGKIDNKNNFIIKNKSYKLKDLLDERDLTSFTKGSYGLIYLSPSNYHRFHAMTDCTIIKQYSLGDKSEPVNDMGLNFGDDPIIKNYRIIQKLKDQKDNIFYVIYIGAVNVNSIIIHDKKNYKKAEEVGYFQFGSSILLLIPDEMAEFMIEEHSTIKYGQKLLYYK